jgi:hypothetical protein
MATDTGLSKLRLKRRYTVRSNAEQRSRERPNRQSPLGGDGFLVADNDDGTGPDLGRVARLVEEGPDVTGVVFVVAVRGDVHAV